MLLCLMVSSKCNSVSLCLLGSRPTGGEHCYSVPPEPSRTRPDSPGVDSQIRNITNKFSKFCSLYIHTLTDESINSDLRKLSLLSVRYKDVSYTETCCIVDCRSENVTFGVRRYAFPCG